MSYNSSIPNVTDFLVISQKQLLANYQAIFNSFAQNHVKLGAENNTQGQHNSLTLRLQTLDPATTATESALYNKLDAFSVPQLFFRPSSNQTAIQLTNSSVTQSSSSTEFRQSSFVAGPFTVYMGFFTNVANNTVVTLTPSSTLLYVGLSTSVVGPLPTAVNVAIPVNITGNQFTIKYVIGLPAPAVIFYMAIGNS